MKRKLLSTLVAAAFGVAAGAAQAQITDGVIKIGVMNDMSGLYADISGPGALVAARLAVEDFRPRRPG
jgi:branched-chain amino acid transport system substrate-binding protein